MAWKEVDKERARLQLFIGDTISERLSIIRHFTFIVMDILIFLLQCIKTQNYTGGYHVRPITSMFVSKTLQKHVRTKHCHDESVKKDFLSKQNIITLKLGFTHIMHLRILFASSVGT
jgi:hypothetical protein